MAGPTREFWQRRFEEGATPWDRGACGPQVARWIELGALAPCRILVPGCGSGHEVAEFARLGFDATGIDYAPAAIELARARAEALGPRVAARARFEQADALTWQPAEPFDAVYEQTCLCAIYPDHWVEYARQVHRWLRPAGALFAMFLQMPRPASAQGFIEGPPYHCDINAMRALFDARHWQWPKPPYDRIDYPTGNGAELAVVLRRVDAGAEGAGAA